jgi:hypothetical protein
LVLRSRRPASCLLQNLKMTYTHNKCTVTFKLLMPPIASKKQSNFT